MLLTLSPLFLGHASLVIPTPRNAMDGGLPDFIGGKVPHGGTACTCANGQECDMGVRREGGSGQPCLWWSQGCSIGCEYCVTDPRHEANNGSIPTRAIEGAWPHTDKAGFRTAYCDTPAEPVLPKAYWTMNRHAVDGAINDSYRHNPWRAPGKAPVVDPCGQAGGKYKQTPMGGDSVFMTTQYAKMGDLGSQVLPPTAGALPKWVAGSHAEVAWGMRFNHGGGYQCACMSAGRTNARMHALRPALPLHHHSPRARAHGLSRANLVRADRLCPADSPLTEECFQANPLDFVRDQQRILWNNGSATPIRGVFVDEQVCPVVPAGSTWARNPIPRINTDNLGLAFVGQCTTGPPRREMWSASKSDCQQFDSACPSLDTDWFQCTDGKTQGGCDAKGNNDHWGWCSGDWTLGMVADKVVVPKSLKPGKYVVGWRLDCEETAQSTRAPPACRDLATAPFTPRTPLTRPRSILCVAVWQNCADIEVVA